MKFASFVDNSGKTSWGVLGDSQKILDLSAKWPSLLAFLESGQWENQLLEINSQLSRASIPVSSVKFLSPLPLPTQVRDGYAFRQHVEASRKNRGLPMIPEFEQFPVFYYGNRFSTYGEGDIPVREKAADRLDFELEVAIVIGKQGRNIKAKDADDYIFGYMIMNDWSARGWWSEEFKMSMGPAKGKDFANSFGPYLVDRKSLSAFAKRDERGEKLNLKMKAFLNGKQISEGNVTDMYWSFAQIIERASYGVTLFPGEVIGSGTCGSGCFFETNGFEKEGRTWLQMGDTVVLEVDQLGRLENRVVPEKV